MLELEFVSPTQCMSWPGLLAVLNTPLSLSTLVGYLMKLPFEGLLKFNNIDMERFAFNSPVPSLTADGQARFY